MDNEELGQELDGLLEWCAEEMTDVLERHGMSAHVVLNAAVEMCPNGAADRAAAGEARASVRARVDRCPPPQPLSPDWARAGMAAERARGADSRDEGSG